MNRRPLVTFAVVAYNQSRFVREAILGAFAQTWSPLQLILSDDASRDDTFDIMEAMASDYRGPHRIVLNRNPRNLGIGGHVNRIMELAEGELVVAAAGDDISVAHRTETLADHWLTNPGDIASLHSALFLMNPDGTPAGIQRAKNTATLDDVGHMARTGHSVRGASHAWSRAAFDRFGPLLPSVVQEDIVMSLRFALVGRIVYVDEPLVRWRLGSTSWKPRLHDGSPAAEARESARRHARIGLVNAIQALVDVERAGRLELLPSVCARLRDARVQLQLAEGELPEWSELVRSLLDGASIRHLLRLAIEGRAEGRLRPLYELSLQVKKLRRHARRWSP